MKNLALFVVAGFLAFILLGSCKKNKDTKNYAANLGGTRILHGTFFTPFGSNVETDTVVITVVNNTTINVTSTTMAAGFYPGLTFASEDDQLKIIIFSYSTPPNTWPWGSASLQYYYASDSMVYQANWGSSGAHFSKSLTTL